MVGVEIRKRPVVLATGLFKFQEHQNFKNIKDGTTKNFNIYE